MAKERVRLVCLYVHDLEWVMRLNAKYASMVRSSLAVPVHRHLMREATENGPY